MLFLPDRFSSHQLNSTLETCVLLFYRNSWKHPFKIAYSSPALSTLLPDFPAGLAFLLPEVQSGSPFPELSLVVKISFVYKELHSFLSHL